MRYTGAKYHLTARGNGRDQVFFGEEDDARFVQQLEAAVLAESGMTAEDLRFHGHRLGAWRSVELELC